MDRLNLTDSECKILALVELNAELSAPEIAKKTRLKTPTVHRILSSFRENEIFAGRTAVVDTDRLGLVEYGIALSLGTASSDVVEKFFEFAIKKRAISWVAEVGGGFDVLINVLADKPQTALEVLFEIEKRFPLLIQEKAFCIRTKRFRFWRGFLNGRTTKLPRFSIGLSGEKLSLPPQDTEVLAALSSASFETYRELASQIRMPIATFLRRIAILRKQKILLGFGYRMNLEKVGVKQFRVLVFSTQCSQESEKTMLSFAASCPWIKLVTTCLGPWCFELEIDIINQSTARDVASEIRKALGKSVHKVVLLPIFSHRKFISFPPASSLV